MSDGRASKTLDDLLTVLLEDDAADDVPMDAAAQAEMKAMVKSTTALVDRLHRERTMRRLAEAEDARKKKSRQVEAYGGPLPSMERLVAELRGLMTAAGREAAFHAMKFQDMGPEDLAELIVSARHLLKGDG